MDVPNPSTQHPRASNELDEIAAIARMSTAVGDAPGVGSTFAPGSNPSGDLATATRVVPEGERHACIERRVHL